LPQVLSIPTPLNDGIPGNPSSPIPLKTSESPAVQSDYPNVKFWTKRAWLDHHKESKDISNPTRKVGGVRGKVRSAQGENVKMLYVEDEQGNTVNGNRASDMRRVARSIWIELARTGKAPKKWGRADVRVADYYKGEMRHRFPELRLCDQDWKADQIAIDNYPSWYQNFFWRIRLKWQCDFSTVWETTTPRIISSFRSH
jgi:hypothetical protein